VAGFLLSKGADINARDAQGLSPLLWTVSGADSPAFYALARKYVKREKRGEKPRPLLITSAQFVGKETVEYLLKNGADPNATGKDGIKDVVKVLSLATSSDRLDLVESVLDVWTGVKGNDKSVMVEALIMAVSIDNRPDVELVLKKGAEINGTNSIGRTALHIAAKQNHLEMAKFLLSRGADITARDRSGKIPYDYAKEWVNIPELAQTLKP
jgi:ankyrin repeat protein